MLITMPLIREDANVLCFSCSTGLHLSHIAFVKCPIGGKSLTDLIGRTYCILCQHMPMQDRKRSRALRGGCNILKPLSTFSERFLLNLKGLHPSKRFAVPEEVSLMAALDACGRGASAFNGHQTSFNYAVWKFVPWNMATSEGQVDLFTNQRQQGSLLLLMHFQHGF